MHKNMSCSSFLSTKSAKEQNSYEELIQKKDAMERIAVKKNFMVLFYGYGSTVFRLQDHL